MKKILFFLLLLSGIAKTQPQYYTVLTSDYSSVILPSGFSFPDSTSHTLQFLKVLAGGGYGWATVSGGSGTVTSVDMSVPAFLSVSGNPITTSGTLAVTLASQSQNLLFASPDGSSGTPTFRSLTAGDIPVGSVGTSKIAGSAVTLAKIQNATASSRLLGSGSSGSGSAYSEIAVGTGLTMSGTTLNTTTNSYQASPSDPTGVSSSTTEVMMGLAGSITPNGSGVIFIQVTGNTDAASAQANANGGCIMQLRYGTSTAPTNGATATGTPVGSHLKAMLATSTSSSLTRNFPFTLTAIVTGLTPGTAYWIDVSMGQASSNGNASQLKNISITAFEL